MLPLAFFGSQGVLRIQIVDGGALPARAMPTLGHIGG